VDQVVDELITSTEMMAMVFDREDLDERSMMKIFL
jgi:hypothetical protein